MEVFKGFVVGLLCRVLESFVYVNKKIKVVIKIEFLVYIWFRLYRSWFFVLEFVVFVLIKRCFLV